MIAQLDESNQKCQAQEEAVGEKQLLIEAVRSCLNSPTTGLFSQSLWFHTGVPLHCLVQGQRQRVESQRVAHEIGEKLETERLKRQRLEEELKVQTCP